MVSRKQPEANRANAKRSSGPRSADGKARSSRNSLKHGLTAEDIVIGREDPAEFELLLAGLQRDFEPTTTIENKLVQRLAALLWRLQRIPVLEAALFDVRQEETASGDLFTLNVTVEQEEALISMWYNLQEPEYQEFLEKFFRSAPKPPTPTAPNSNPESDTLKTEPIKNDQPATAPILASKQSSSNDVGVKPTAEKRSPTRQLRLRQIEKGEASRRRFHTGLALIKDAEHHDVLGKLARYEASLASAVTRTLALLNSLRNSRLLRDEEQPHEYEIRRP